MDLSKNKIKYIKSLQQKKFRRKYDKFVVEGDKIALEMLRQSRIRIDSVYALDSWLETNKELLSLPAEKVFSISERDLKKISGLSSPNQVLIVADQPLASLDEKQVAEDYSLYLDGIRDPGNFGTIIRIADWFGITHVFCSPECVDLYNPKVLQATMGAFLRVSCQTVPLRTLSEKFPDLPVLGAAMEGEDLFDAELPGRGILVIGNEGRGIAPGTNELIHRRFTIPRHADSGAESLNAAVATGIMCAVLRNN